MFPFYLTGVYDINRKKGIAKNIIIKQGINNT